MEDKVLSLIVYVVGIILFAIAFLIPWISVATVLSVAGSLIIINADKIERFLDEH